MLSKIDRNLIRTFLKDYLKARIPDFTTNKKLFTCPSCKQVSANIYPEGKVFCYSPTCKNLGDIIDVARIIDYEGNRDVDDFFIANELKKEFKINTEDDIMQLLGQFVEWGWDLVPVSKNSKASDVEKEWTKKSHKDLTEWKSWLSSGLNIGVKCGEMSNVICFDFDFVEKKLKDKIYAGKGTTKDFEEAINQWNKGLEIIKKEMPYLVFTTVSQNTFGGLHLFYIHDSEIKKCVINVNGVHVDVQSDGGQVVIQPSIVGGQPRKLTGTEIKPTPKELKDFLLQSKKTEIPKEQEPDLVNGELPPDYFDKIKGLEGKCNSVFVKVLGQFRKFMSFENVEKSAYLINREMLDDPMDNKSVRGMCQQIEKYHVADVNVIGEKIIEHLKIVETAHVRDLKECLNFDRKDLEQALKILIDHKKIYKIKKDLYKSIQDTEWQEDFMSLGKPLPFKVPYLDEYSYFDNGSLVILGASSGYGKTTLSVNLIKKFVEQGVTPHLISTEAGSKFQKIAQSVGLKEGDFKYFITTEPTSVTFQPNSVTILDWLKPADSDYAKFDSIYEKLNNQLVEKGGLLIVLAQLKKENKAFYSENMTLFYGALVAKLLYEMTNGVEDNSKPYLETVKIRESKTSKQYITIPLSYDYQTKLIEVRK